MIPPTPAPAAPTKGSLGPPRARCEQRGVNVGEFIDSTGRGGRKGFWERLATEKKAGEKRGRYFRSTILPVEEVEGREGEALLAF